MATLALAYGLTFSDLYENDGLQRIDDAFTDHLKQVDGNLNQRLVNARSKPNSLDERGASDPVSYTHLTLPTICSV